MSRETPTPMEYLESNVKKMPSGCWIWTGTIGNRGYGYASLNGRSTGAHRFSYAVMRGPITKGLHILHTCDVKACVNPDHLYQGTDAQNLRDAYDRNRRSQKLSPENLKEVRQLILDGVSHSKIAKKFLAGLLAGLFIGFCYGYKKGYWDQ